MKLRYFEILARIRLPDSECIIASNQVGDTFQAVTFDRIKEETLKDKQMMKLIHYKRPKTTYY